MLNTMLNTIQKYNMIKANDKILVALSGGADSVALLTSLYELKDDLKIEISAIHINHNLRGLESKSDQSFCEDLCKKKAIELYVENFDVKNYSTTHKLSIEEAARNIRYDFFYKYSKNKIIATAHTASDNLETILINLTRGTGLKGLIGIPPVRDNIIRPLINLSREEIENYLVQKNQNFVTDSSNLSDDYTRNKIRHHVIPILKNINTSILKTVSNNTNLIETDNNFIENSANQVFLKCFKPPFSLENLHLYHKSIRYRCISNLLKINDLEYNHKKISEIDALVFNYGKINISKNTFAISNENVLKIEIIKQLKNNEIYIEKKFELGNLIFKDKIIYSEILSLENYNIFKKNNQNLSTFFIDYDKIKEQFIVRSRKPGDKIKLQNRNFNSSVKKLLNEFISQEKRKSLCFFESNMELVAIEGIGCSDTVKIDNTTQNVLYINIKDI